MCLIPDFLWTTFLSVVVVEPNDVAVAAAPSAPAPRRVRSADGIGDSVSSRNDTNGGGGGAALVLAPAMTDDAWGGWQPPAPCGPVPGVPLLKALRPLSGDSIMGTREAAVAEVGIKMEGPVVVVPVGCEGSDGESEEVGVKTGSRMRAGLAPGPGGGGGVGGATRSGCCSPSNEEDRVTSFLAGMVEAALSSPLL